MASERFQRRVDRILDQIEDAADRRGWATVRQGALADPTPTVAPTATPAAATPPLAMDPAIMDVATKEALSVLKKMGLLGIWLYVQSLSEEEPGGTNPMLNFGASATGPCVSVFGDGDITTVVSVI